MAKSKQSISGSGNVVIDGNNNSISINNYAPQKEKVVHIVNQHDETKHNPCTTAKNSRDCKRNRGYV